LVLSKNDNERPSEKKWCLIDGVDWIRGAAQIRHIGIPKERESQEHGKDCTNYAS
jgi:hypothetical protein